MFHKSPKEAEYRSCDQMTKSDLCVGLMVRDDEKRFTRNCVGETMLSNQRVITISWLSSVRKKKEALPWRMEKPRERRRRDSHSSYCVIFFALQCYLAEV